jgi:hypothetical protein
MVEWLTHAVAAGLNIQPVGLEYERRRGIRLFTFLDDLESLKAEQRLQWARFDTLKKNGALKDIRGVLENYVAAMTAWDANGLLAVHVAAVYDRIDALSWSNSQDLPHQTRRHALDRRLGRDILAGTSAKLPVTVRG